MKKIILLMGLFLVLVSMSALASQITPQVPPSAPADSAQIYPYPSLPDSAEVVAVSKYPGLFHWGRDTELSGFYLYNNRQTELLGVVGAKLDFLFPDPWYVGEKLGLAEDALEYKAGLGVLLGHDLNNNGIFSIPANFEAALYLKEGTFFGFDPFVCAALNVNLYGTEGTVSGAGMEAGAGFLFGPENAADKKSLALKFSTFRVGSLRQAQGLSLTLSQPIRL